MIRNENKRGIYAVAYSLLALALVGGSDTAGLEKRVDELETEQQQLLNANQAREQRECDLFGCLEEGGAGWEPRPW